MSLEAHHRFILDTMQRNQEIAMNIINELEAENARLKAEVGELADALKLASEVGIKIADEVTRLKDEVERLRKAGDAVCESPYLWENDPSVIAWRAAKEGKPSA